MSFLRNSLPEIHLVFVIGEGNYAMLIAVCILFSTYSCGRDSKVSTDDKVTEEIVYKGEITNPQQTWYRSTQALYDDAKNKVEGFAAYNEPNHSLDWYAFSDEKIVFQRETKLVLEGPNAIGKIRGFYVHSPDSIFLVSRNTITIVDENGGEKYRLNVATANDNSLAGLDLSRFHPNVEQGSGIRTSFMNGKLYLPLNYYEYEGYKDVRGLAKGVNLVGSLDISDNSFKMLPIFYPESISDQAYGFAVKPSFSYAKNKIVYSFVGFPEVYVYDIPSEQISMINGEGNYPRTEPLGNLDISEHLQTMMQFSDGVVDPSGHNYYQAILKPKVPNERREIFIRAINLDTEQVETIPLPFRAGFNGMLPGVSAVSLPIMQRAEDSIAYRRVAF